MLLVAAARGVVNVLRAVFGTLLREIEPAANAFVSLRLDLQAGKVGALEGHELPASDRRICADAGCISPAAKLRILRSLNEVDGALGWAGQFVITGHAVGFRKRDRGDCMAIEPGALVGLLFLERVKVAALLLLIDEIAQAAPHNVAMLVVEVVVTRAKERQQRQSSGGGVRTANSGVRVGRARKMLEAPASVFLLCTNQEVEAALDGFLGLCILLPATRAAFDAGPFEAARRLANETFDGNGA